MDNNYFQNWVYYDENPDLGLQSMSSIRNPTNPFQENPLMTNPNDSGNMAPGYHHQPPIPIPYMQNSWIQREGKRHIPAANPEMHNDASGSNSMNIMQSIDSSIDHGMSIEDHVQASWAFVSKLGDDVGSSNPHEKRSEMKNPTIRRSRLTNQSMELIINGIEIDTPKIPIPVCSCTGTPQKCYRWGKSGWQSTCCTATISKYPLPMGTTRHGTRIAGRKMSKGTFKLVLEQLLSNGHNFSNPIDLKTHWAKHGSNKFRAIKMFGPLAAP